MNVDAIVLERVGKRFARARGAGQLEILRDFNLRVEAGETLAIIGASGCGKSTLLNILALLEPADEGDVLIGGRRCTPVDAGTVSMGYLFQRDALLPWRTAIGNALLGMECRGLEGNDVNERASEYFTRFGLEGFEHAWPHTLSGGQRQRVALIQNLLPDPDILLLDEPFGSLDYQTKLTLEEELLSVIRSRDTATIAGAVRRKTVVFVTHDIEEAVTLGDRVMVLGQPPTGILLDLRVELADEQRLPVAARQSDVMKKLFGQIWGILRGPESPSSQLRTPFSRSSP
jgi:NitT/TauT family transport system ATP-binding protein